MADVYTEGYRIGFINTGKDLSKKKVVNIRYSLGFEKVVRLAIENFKKMGLKPVIYRAAASVITKREHHKIGYYGCIANQQLSYSILISYRCPSCLLRQPNQKFNSSDQKQTATNCHNFLSCLTPCPPSGI